MFLAPIFLSVRYVAAALLCKAAIVAIVTSTAIAEQPVRLIALGDSLTHGFGLPQGDGFVPQLQKWLTDQGRTVEVINMGVSGDTTEGGRARLGWALADGADAVILELGGNDLLRGIDPARSRANLEAMLVEMRGKGLPVLLAGMQAPLNYGADFKRDFDAMYPDLAQAHGAVLYPSFVGGLVGEAALMQSDGIHPNKDGVAVIIKGIGPKVLELLDQIGG